MYYKAIFHLNNYILLLYVILFFIPVMLFLFLCAFDVTIYQGKFNKRHCIKS